MRKRLIFLELSAPRLENSLLDAIDPYIGYIITLIGILRFVTSSKKNGKKEILFGLALVLWSLYI